MMQTIAKSGRSQRKLSNVKLTKRFRSRYLGLWIFVSAAHVVLADILIYLLFKEKIANMAVAEGFPGVAALVPEGLMISVLAIHAILLTLALVCLSVMTVHRVAGPYLGIIRTCNAIADGKIFERLKFRDYDGLEDVAAAFNGMTDALQRNSVTEHEGHRLKVVGE